MHTLNPGAAIWCAADLQSAAMRLRNRTTEIQTEPDSAAAALPRQIGTVDEVCQPTQLLGEQGFQRCEVPHQSLSRRALSHGQSQLPLGLEYRADVVGHGVDAVGQLAEFIAAIPHAGSRVSRGARRAVRQRDRSRASGQSIGCQSDERHRRLPDDGVKAAREPRTRRAYPFRGVAKVHG